MNTIYELERQLTIAKTEKENMPAPYIQTDIIIDLRGANGNVLYILGLCNRIAKQYNVPEWARENIIGKLNTLKYEDILSICQKYFGLIYIR